MQKVNTEKSIQYIDFIRQWDYCVVITESLIPEAPSTYRTYSKGLKIHFSIMNDKNTLKRFLLWVPQKRSIHFTYRQNIVERR